MGDRGNVCIKENAADNGVYLYSHWTGFSLPQVVSHALDRGRGRWGDTPYLTRIIFCDMVEGDEKAETGFGISTSECDPNHPTIFLNDSAQTVTIEGNRWSYEEFSRAGTAGVPLGDSASDKAALYKCKCCG